MHASAIARFPEAYEHTPPESVGNTQRMLVSELAGKASLVAKARGLGVDLSAHAEKVQAILDNIKEREAAGYSYETADGSLALLLKRHLGAYRPHFTLESFRVIVDDREDTGALAKDAMSEATIKIHVGGERFVATGEGAGPVGALDTALRMAIGAFYPQVADMELWTTRCASSTRTWAPTPSRASSSPRATAATAGAPWACPRTSSRRRGTRWWIPSSTGL